MFKYLFKLLFTLILLFILSCQESHTVESNGGTEAENQSSEILSKNKSGEKDDIQHDPPTINFFNIADGESSSFITKTVTKLPYNSHYSYYVTNLESCWSRTWGHIKVNLNGSKHRYDVVFKNTNYVKLTGKNRLTSYSLGVGTHTFEIDAVSITCPPAPLWENFEHSRLIKRLKVQIFVPKAPSLSASLTGINRNPRLTWNAISIPNKTTVYKIYKAASTSKYEPSNYKYMGSTTSTLYLDTSESSRKSSNYDYPHRYVWYKIKASYNLADSEYSNKAGSLICLTNVSVK